MSVLAEIQIDFLVVYPQLILLYYSNMFRGNNIKTCLSQRNQYSVKFA